MHALACLFPFHWVFYPLLRLYLFTAITSLCYKLFTFVNFNLFIFLIFAVIRIRIVIVLIRLAWFRFLIILIIFGENNVFKRFDWYLFIVCLWLLSIFFINFEYWLVPQLILVAFPHCFKLVLKVIEVLYLAHLRNYSGLRDRHVAVWLRNVSTVIIS